MVNIEDFIKRLEKILDYYHLSASSFADKIGVQRSSLSHLLSGRNKPSLDFILKILEVFPEVDLYWILNGTGSFPKKNQEELVLQKHQNKTEADFTTAHAPIPSLKNTIENSLSTSSEKIEKIVVFYSNGTFKEYKPE